LSNSERQEFQETFQAVLSLLLSRPAAIDRRPYLFGIAFFPTAERGIPGEA
jgi:hypothetical protein